VVRDYAEHVRHVRVPGRYPYLERERYQSAE
jgi:hypothetical protein